MNGVRFHAAEFLQIVHKFVEAFSFVVNLLVRFIVCGKHAVHQTFGGTFDGGQRCAQLVRHIADETAAHRLDLFKLQRHLVETRRKLTQLIRAMRLHTFFIVTLGNALAGVLHALQRRDDASAQKITRQQANHRRGDKGNDQRLIERRLKTLIEVRHHAALLTAPLPLTLPVSHCRFACHLRFHELQMARKGTRRSELRGHPNRNHADQRNQQKGSK